MSDQRQHGRLNAAMWLLELFKQDFDKSYSRDAIDGMAYVESYGEFDVDDLDDALARLLAGGFLHLDHVLGLWSRNESACDGLDHEVES